MNIVEQHQTKSSPTSHPLSGPTSKSPTGTASDWSPVFESDPRPLIPEGEYLCLCTGGKKFYHPMFKRPVAVLRFQPIDTPFVGTPLERFFSIGQRRDPKSKRLREFIGRNSIYLREWVICNQGRPPRRRERMPLSKFFGKVFLVRVRTIERTWDDLEHPASLRYSTVRAILSLEATNEPVLTDKGSQQVSASKAVTNALADIEE